MSEQFVVGTDLRERLCAEIACVDAALQSRWWHTRLPDDLAQAFETESEDAERASFRFWFICVVGLQFLGLARDLAFGVLELGFVLRVSIAIPATATVVWLLRKKLSLQMREALTSAAFLTSVAVLVALGNSVPQPAADRYLMAAMFGFSILHLLMPFTLRQIVGHAVVCGVALGFTAWLRKSGTGVISDRLEILLPTLVALLSLGALLVLHNRQRSFLLEFRSRLQAAALEEANKALILLLRRDMLTGIHNRRYFDETMQQVWRQMLAAGKPLGVILLDIDYFKSFNDRRGHQEGDRCLKEVARCLDASLRDSDQVAARYGGEEFAVILPGVSCLEAYALGERLRKAVEGLGLPHPEGGVATVSVGVAACVPDRTREPHMLVDAADGALYASKQAGRNCVTANVVMSEQEKSFEAPRAAAG